MGAIPAIISQLCALALMVGCAAQQRETDFEGLLTSEARAVIVDYDLQGMTVAVVGPNGAVTAATGVANREDQAPMTPETTMRAATVLQLSEEETLAQDDPISRWLGDGLCGSTGCRTGQRSPFDIFSSIALACRTMSTCRHLQRSGLAGRAHEQI